jgi:hypothetical protein
VPKWGPLGFVRGARSNASPYRDRTTQATANITDAGRFYLSAELKKMGIRHLFPNELA